MNSNKDIVGQIGEVASHALTPKVQQTLTATIHESRNYASTADDRDSLIRGEEKILARFRRLFEKQFSALVEFGIDYEEEKAKVRDFANLRLMVDDDLEAVIAMEGMVTYARKRLLEQSLPPITVQQVGLPEQPENSDIWDRSPVIAVEPKGSCMHRRRLRCSYRLHDCQ